MKPAHLLLIHLFFESVKVVNPLKQGLKPIVNKSLLLYILYVKVVNPLKQGLKCFFRYSYSGSSSKLK